MTRTLALTALLAAGLAAPAFAAGEQTNANASATEIAALSFAANANQVQKLLGAQGYTQVSVLGRDDHGRWTGVALKDGQQRLFAVGLRGSQPQPITN